MLKAGNKKKMKREKSPCVEWRRTEDKPHWADPPPPPDFIDILISHSMGL